ncbi:MAG: DUF6457 domain-containing protein [Microthrixaceae bacterium]|nr:molybdopterin-guanine dinucleotide biosynthesis protein [Actinomycetota bacterium]MBP6728090.1 hypothetical protein [Microthrixaceae bacterium]HMS12081.1 DUF6457 domain-containing protein [Microthrixaceae bacterium]HMT22909.1 DUF6457 domain-containing protein [Microthrixaceae bacterium]HMT61184.1 DUF6457 domain-containing protein [Microthrixaceae bacterium]
MSEDDVADARPDGRAWVASFAAQLGIDPPDADEVERLLELASVAAHASERLAAPLACWLVGRAGLDASTAIELGRRLDGSQG